MRLRVMALSVVIATSFAAPAGSQTLTTLYNFTTSSGGFAESGLAFDTAGNLVGTRAVGEANPAGSVFRLSGNGGGGYSYSSLFDFNGTNGSTPQAGVIIDSAGNIFGTTAGGGANGRGTVYRLSDNGAGGYAHTILFNFTNTPATGRAPAATLMADANGHLYGTTTLGGASPAIGNVFRLANDGAGNYTHSTLHSFTVPTAGTGRRSSLIVDAGGNLYGTTEIGGSSAGGTVYRLANNGAGGYNYAALANFGGPSGGRQPASGLIADAAGSLYGVTFAGGTFNNGTVFKVSDNGAGGYTTTILHNFNHTNGGSPLGGLIADAVGNLFGTTYGGGGEFAPGTVFRLSDNGAGGYTHTVLYTFGGSNGIKPYGDLIADDEGNLYGMTQFGGANDSGTIFRISNAGFVVTETVATPEPVSLAIFGMALAGLAARRHPRHKV
ncbi:MAG: PEP-CTERM sorting domain-containing protein [Planctomycetes bacterium]|nr:PEP-CTERM sorting domain-containing protein [Planctomycetota bacterium]